MSELDHHQLLTNVISGEDPANTIKMYNDWSQTYDVGMQETAYCGPKTLMEHFHKLNVPKEGKILDICAGTGAIGKHLVELGYTDLHAIDGAEAMLAKAKAQGNYKSYTNLLFTPGSKLPYEDSQFDCVLMAGVFAPGHLPIVVLHEVCRVLKVGGVVAWINCDPKYYEKEGKDKQYANNGFYQLIDDIKSKGIWKEREGFPVPVPYIEYSDGFVMAFDIIGK